MSRPVTVPVDEEAELSAFGLHNFGLDDECAAARPYSWVCARRLACYTCLRGGLVSVEGP